MRQIINSILKYHNESFNAYLLTTTSMVVNSLKFNVIPCTAHHICFFKKQKKKTPVEKNINKSFKYKIKKKKKMSTDN